MCWFLKARQWVLLVERTHGRMQQISSQFCLSQTLNNHGPTGLEIEETLTNINSGFSSRVVIQVRNSTDHDILLPKRTILGRLQLVKSVTPVEVREKCDKEAQVNGVSVNDDKLNTNTPDLLRWLDTWSWFKWSDWETKMSRSTNASRRVRLFLSRWWRYWL